MNHFTSSRERPVLLQPTHIEFSMFTEEDIKNLSVIKIATSTALDASGYPVRGGLYDKVLGPISKFDSCGTCFKTIYDCPGHYSYIELPLPVTNPLFYRIIYLLLRMTCLECFAIQLSEHVKNIYTLQLKLINCGLVNEAHEVETILAALIDKYKSLDRIPKGTVLATEKYEELVNRKSAEVNHQTLNKNTEDFRNYLLNEIFKTTKATVYCCNCKKAIDKMSMLQNKIVTQTHPSTIKDKPDKDEVEIGELKPVREIKYKFITPGESREYLRSIYKAEPEFIRQLLPILMSVKSEFPTDVFFCQTLLVPPPNVRPVTVVGASVSENPQTKLYKSIMDQALATKIAIYVAKNNGDTKGLSNEARNVYNSTIGSTPTEKLNNMWENLQTLINGIVDRDSKKNGDDTLGNGLKQLIERKKGIIRQNMMGKRVNYAARSVIAPDPNLSIQEVGIPETFATTLTYPVPVTPWNIEELRKLVLNGPAVHPGATMIECENGVLIKLSATDSLQRQSIAKRLLTPEGVYDGFRGVKIVYRHLVNGDAILLNRQPTLHKPSIMAHTVRILKGEKVIRLHYANCKAYNADFDGDEMNAHFPQNELCRGELYNIANVSNQYLVPKDGTPLSGLIQDHMVSGVRLSVRGKFFTKQEYQQLVYQGISYKTSEIKLLPPAILKPQQLWTGKQVISSVIINTIPEGKEQINLTATAKIPFKAWMQNKPREWKHGGTPFKYDNCMSEEEVVIRNGELLVGVLDKAHYGATPYGLVHCINELYGGTYAVSLLSSFAKLFTYFLQTSGFTLGPLDILLTPKADKKRKKIINQSRKVGRGIITSALELDEDTPLEDIVEKLEELGAIDPNLRATIDRHYKSRMDSFTNDINKACLPAGLLCKFPDNNLQLMVQSGAKGSTVNTMQISCLLGQIELEGKRPPKMISGKSLPCYPNYEFSPQSGGFVVGRFMSGLSVQEFFFHCMAGREGLIDTAVKTSRSGYLQRCLIKHLEGIQVGYDMTVRNSDGTIVQFLYGEDGMDICKTKFFNKQHLSFLKDNIKAILDKDRVNKLKSDEDVVNIQNHITKIDEWKKTNGNVFRGKKKNAFSVFTTTMNKNNIKDAQTIDPETGREKQSKLLVKVWNSAKESLKRPFHEKCAPCPDPANYKFAPHVFGAMNERLWDLVKNCNVPKKDKKKFENMMKQKALESLAHPGEPVGLLAAQSVGEPSTQMTLNTFHFAGRGDMNVTLGIPRLREILMMASRDIKTPYMEVPFKDVPDLKKKSDNLRRALTRVVVADVLKQIDVNYKLDTSHKWQHIYTLRFNFHKRKLYKSQYNIKQKAILEHMTTSFFGDMFAIIRTYTKHLVNNAVMEDEKKPAAKSTSADNEEDDLENDDEGKTKEGIEGGDSSDEEPEDPEDAKQMHKYQEAHDEQEPDEEEKVMSDDEFSNPPTNDNNDAEDSVDVESKIISTYRFAQSYKYDTKKHLWCELTFGVPVTTKHMDLSSILREAAGKSVLYQVKGVKSAITYKKDDKLYLRTLGINIGELFKYNQLLDLSKLYSNDIHKIAGTFGIEAASKAIAKEVNDVFKVYGITVDPRHLTLIADYMTSTGVIEPLNRKGIETSPSPFQQMSYEASLQFLKTSVMLGKKDYLNNPSSNLMIGKVCNSGTGSFSLRAKVVDNPC